MTDLQLRVQTAAGHIRNAIPALPRIALVLGSGLGAWISPEAIRQRIPYADIPGFPVSTVQGHAGALLLIEVKGVQAFVFSGRFHLYEGYDAQDVTLPIRAMALLGVETLILTNAAGALNPLFATGGLMVMTDHINMTGHNPLTGPNDDALGTRFPDMTELYNINLSSRLKTCCEIAGISIDDAYLLVPKDLNTRTDLERKIISLRKELVFSKDVFAGAIVAKHQSIRSAGLLLCESVTKKQKDLLLKSILRMIS